MADDEKKRLFRVDIESEAWIVAGSKEEAAELALGHDVMGVITISPRDWFWASPHEASEDEAPGDDEMVFGIQDDRSAAQLVIDGVVLALPPWRPKKQLEIPAAAETPAAPGPKDPP